MRQHNVDGSRQCWKTARERNRLRARFAIRQRVLLGSDETASSSSSGGGPANGETIQQVLNRIVEGDRSFFSLQYMEEHHSLLNEPFSSQFLWQGKLLLGHQKLLSWFGQDGVQALERCVDALHTCTFIEYAVWLKRYHVLSSFILGGINPCMRGTLQNSILISGDSMKELTVETGTMVKRRFFSGVVPLSLSSYMVKRVVDMRRLSWEMLSNIEDNKLKPETEMEKHSCSVCEKTIHAGLLLYFVSNRQTCQCSHEFCEPCLWKDIMNSMHIRTGEIVQCPTCRRSEEFGGITRRGEEETNISDCSITRRRKEQSLAKYQALPVDGSELKKSKLKKKSNNERNTLCSTWTEAVKSSLGLSQSVRRDKYFVFIEKGSYHYVKGCLEAGIDVDLRNDYGQTALFISTFRGDAELVRLLLSYGCDASLSANGGLTCLNTAMALGHSEITELLQRFGATENEKACRHFLGYCSVQPEHASQPVVKTLIDWSSEHEAAGSFVLDDILSNSIVDSLIDLWKDLPVEESQKKKAGICSVRSYFCDTHGWITDRIVGALARSLGRSATDISVYPHMRFLCYSAPGAVLAPHQDLSRADLHSGKRSTHSMLLYLTDCEKGGETCLLESLSGDGRNLVLARVKPRRGRLLLFPHRCPHEGLLTHNVPKLLIRGEVYLPPG